MKHLILIALSIIGFGISYYIWNKKSHHNKLVCLIGDDKCNHVVTSKYSKQFGIDNAILGMLYFVAIIAAGIIQIVVPTFFSIPLVSWGLLLATAGSVLFSLYLTFVQLAILKEICEYCMASGVVNILIFLVVIFL